MKYSTLLIALAFIAALTNCQTVNAYDLTVIGGLHVQHYGKQEYTDYTQRNVRTVVTKDNTVYSEVTYDKRALNDGFLANQLLGLRVSSNTFALTYITYKNSFYERSHGIGASYIQRISPRFTLELGVMRITGYRPALVQGAENSTNMRAIPVFSPMLAASYAVTQNTQFSYTFAANKVGLLTVSQTFNLF